MDVTVVKFASFFIHVRIGDHAKKLFGKLFLFISAVMILIEMINSINFCSIASLSAECIVVGDFNSILNHNEKQAIGRPSYIYLNIFRNFVNSFGLLDLGFRGFIFTWYNKRQGNVIVRERLNRVLATYP